MLMLTITAMIMYDADIDGHGDGGCDGDEYDDNGGLMLLIMTMVFGHMYDV